MVHAGLGLPEREFYRRTDGEFPSIRVEYEAHLGRLLTLAGQDNVEAQARAIMALETQIAERHWPRADRRDRSRTYNLKTRAEIRAIAPNFPWDAAFEATGMGAVEEVVISELSAMGPLAELFMATPVSTWRSYLTYHVVRNNAAVLPKNIDDEVFAFYGTTLNGQPQQRERWKRAVQAVNGAMGEAIGQIYVQRHFPPASKQQMTDLVENLRTAYGQRIDQLSWMSAETKVVAREKLATFRPKIGYPDRWKNYDGLEVRSGDAYGNNNRQQADTGTKMIHIGRNTTSTIISKGIAAGRADQTYRGQVKIMASAEGARNFTQCDSLLIGDQCGAHTVPYIETHNPTARVEHEATTSRISDDQLFYCMQRGLSAEEAVSVIVNGFCKEVMRTLPMEFAVEAQKLIGISLEGSVG